MRRVKSIDELYLESKNYDFIVTSDADLSAAINLRIDTPRIGNLAYAPRDLARRAARKLCGKKLIDDFEIADTIADRTGYTFIDVYEDLKRIKEILKYTGDIKFNVYSDHTFRVFEELLKLPAVESIMYSFTADQYEYFQGKNVATIGRQFFSYLEMHFIPECDEISIYADDDYLPDKMYRIGNDRQIIENTAEMIDASTAPHTAIVLDSKLESLMRSELYRKNIPCRDVPKPSDLPFIKCYVEFMRLMLRYPRVKDNELNEIVRTYNAELSEETDLSDKVESNVQETLLRLLSEKHTFAELSKSLMKPDQASYTLQLLDYIKCSNLPISKESLRYFEYIINNVKNLPDCKDFVDLKKGVLIKDCHNSCYIDRKNIIFLGLDKDWESDTYNGFVDADEELKTDSERFQILIQQGAKRHYLINNTKQGRETKPCRMFSDVSSNENKIKNFSDICQIEEGHWKTEKERNMVKTSIEASAELPNFTSYSYHQYTRCHRKYMFSKLVPYESDDYFTEFVEFCLCYPELVKKTGLDTYEDLIVGCRDDCESRILRNEVHTHLCNVLEVVESLKCNVPLDLEAKNNRFMTYHNCNKRSSKVNVTIWSDQYNINARYDLLTEEHAIQFKRGKVPEAKDVADGMKIASDKPDFRPLISSALIDVPLRIYYVSEKYSSNNSLEVQILNSNWNEIVYSETTPLRDMLSAKKYAKVVENLDSFIQVLKDANTTCEKWWEDETLGNNVMNSCGVKKDLAKDALKAVKKYPEERVFHNENKILVPCDTVQSLFDQLAKDYTLSRDEWKTDFSISSENCRGCQYTSLCTKEEYSC